MDQKEGGGVPAEISNSPLVKAVGRMVLEEVAKSISGSGGLNKEEKAELVRKLLE